MLHSNPTLVLVEFLGLLGHGDQQCGVIREAGNKVGLEPSIERGL